MYAPNDIAHPFSDPDQILRDEIMAAADRHKRLVVAVSGGGDSMALLHAMSMWAGSRVATIATFDHGTGLHAREAASLVVSQARLLGLPVVRERARVIGRTELEWRNARWDFLRRVAGAHNARVATAHTRDDQVETIVQRMLRGTGARGIAALAAEGPVVRPWLSVSRNQLDDFRSRHSIPHVHDPSNLDRKHQRVRVRLDMLPVLEKYSPGFSDSLLSTARSAAAWRREVDDLVARLPWRILKTGAGQLEREAVRGWDAAQLAVVWPAMAASLGITLSSEGTGKLCRFTMSQSRAGELQLPEGITVVRDGRFLEVRTPAIAARDRLARSMSTGLYSVGDNIKWPGWRIGPCDSGKVKASVFESSSPDFAVFPEGAVLEIRRWQAGDRIRTIENQAGRRISRYLAERGIPRLDRLGWPVVLMEGQVVWVPGVCRGIATPHRSGRSGFIWYHSEREFS